MWRRKQRLEVYNYRPKSASSFLKLRKRQEQTSQGLQKKPALLTPCLQTSGHRNSERTHFYCFKPDSWWSSVMSALQQDDRLFSKPAWQNWLCWRCCSSVAQSRPTLCDFMDCRMPSFPVLHCLPTEDETELKSKMDWFELIITSVWANSSRNCK